MAKIEAGMLVECNIASLDQSLPKEKRTMFGHVVALSEASGDKDVYEVATLQQGGYFRITLYAGGDLSPLVEPMPKYAQRAVLQMTRLFKSQADRAAALLEAIQELLAQS